LILLNKILYKLMERKIQLILGTLALLLIIFGYYKIKNSGEDSSITTPINSTENMDDFKRVMNKLIKVIDKDRKSNKLLLDEIKKLNQLNKLQTKYLRGIKPKIFGKDIEKHRVYIDTHNINPRGLDRSNYVYYFKTSDIENTNNTAGYTEINNVIGFRLVKALIPNTHNVILDNRSQVKIQLGQTGVDGDDPILMVDGVNYANKIINIQLQNGSYTVDSLTNAFGSGAAYSWDNGSLTNPAVGFNTSEDIRSNFGITVSFDLVQRKFTFIMNNNYQFKFLWDDITQNSAASILGFNNTTDYNTSHVSEVNPDMTIHYIDLIINEIPYIACKKNALGKKLIERIGIVNGIGEIIEYVQPWDSDSENYFFPMTLDRLSIELYETSQNHFFDNTRDHSLEFEITTIKNPKEFNLI
tara:strand:- start:326 stop:1564 length:1239 start_codon:yes stop_codon:yes gene_type:complete